MNYKDLYHEIKNDVYKEDDNGKNIERLVIQKQADSDGNIVYYFNVLSNAHGRPMIFILFKFSSSGEIELNTIREFTAEHQAMIVHFLAADGKEWFENIPTERLYTIPIGANTVKDYPNDTMLYVKDVDSMSTGQYYIKSIHNFYDDTTIFFEEEDIENLKYNLNDDFAKVVDLCKNKVGERL